MAKSDGWHLYFQVARRGTEIGILSALICFLLDLTDIIGILIKKHLGLMYNTDFIQVPLTHQDLKLLAWGLVTIAVSYAGAHLKSRKYTNNQSEEFNLLLDVVRDNPLEYFVIDAALTFVNIEEDSKVVCITLSSGKVYIGFCLGGNDVTQGSLKHIEIIPIRSGYRKQGTQDLVITNDYENYFLENNSAIEEFLIVVPTSEITSYQYFDLPAYEAIQAAPSGVSYTDNTYPEPEVTVAEESYSPEESLCHK